MTASDIHNEVIENATADAAASGSNSIPHAPCSVGNAIPRSFIGLGEIIPLALTGSAAEMSKTVSGDDAITQYYPILLQIK